MTETVRDQRRHPRRRPLRAAAVACAAVLALCCAVLTSADASFALAGVSTLGDSGPAVPSGLSRAAILLSGVVAMLALTLGAGVLIRRRGRKRR